MKSDTSPARHTLASRAFFILAVLGGLFLAGVSHAANVTATFNSAADIPVTANGYTATGNTLDVTLNFAPTPGTNLTVVRNTALTFINGQFSNVANGATLNLTYNGTTYPFVAWYYGGTGNDLVLLWPYTGLAAWGYNDNGRLGDNTTMTRRSPVPVVQAGVLAGKTIVQLARGGGHTLALTSEGKVYSWGYNQFGGLGDSTSIDRLEPVAVNTANGSSALFGKTVIAIAAGNAHSLALCSDGSIAAWGYNVYGQIGDATTTDRLSPVAVNTASGTSFLFGKSVTAIAVGSMHNLALCSDGTVAAWGLNSNNHLGDTTYINRSSPVAVNTVAGTSILYGKTVTALAAGNQHSLALCSDGTVAAWGANNNGQLGDNSTFPHSVPVAVNTTSGTSAIFGRVVTSLAAGDSHSIALCSDGTVVAWGANNYGQLGDNSGTQRNAPVNVNTASGVSALFGKFVTAIATGYFNSLALCSDGSVTAWGENGNGQVGDNTNIYRSAPAAVNTNSGTSALAGKHVSGLGASGSSSSHFVAAYGTTAPEIAVEVLEPSVMPLVDNANTLDYGITPYGVRTFRIRNEGGLPLNGVSGTLSDTNVEAFSISQPPSSIPPGGTAIIQVVFASETAGAKSAKLEISSNDSDENPFRIALTGTRPSLSDLTATFSSASDIPLTAFGFNASGIALNTTLNFAPNPGTNLTVIRNTGTNFIRGQFSNAPNGATLNLTYNGTIYPFVAWYYGGAGRDLVLLWPYTGLTAWGSNNRGQLGDNSPTQRNAPSFVEQSGALNGKTIVQVVCGGSHTLALTSEGKVYAWGYNFYGQLGINSTSDSYAPVAVNADAGSSALFGKTVIAIGAGSIHSLAMCSDGTIVGWGDNSYGQLGDNTTTQRNTPVAVNTASGTSALFGKTVTAVAAGGFHSLAVCSDGTVAAWGSNNYGQLGDNTSMPHYAPVAVNTTSGTSALFGKTVTAVAGGGSHSLALCSDGAVVAWGDNNGQLGNNSGTWSFAPVAVNTTSGTSALFSKAVTAISAGGKHSVALCSDGTVAAWGENFYGQLGDNTNTYPNTRNVPTAVNTTTGISALYSKTAIAIAAGSAHSLTLCSDGTLATWGDNSYGQLGDNTTTQRRAPVTVNTANGISVLSGRIVKAINSSGTQSGHSTAVYGLLPPKIEIEVLEPVLTALADNANTLDYGAVLSGVRTIRIRNTGEAPLIGISAALTGVNSSDFAIASPTSMTISGGNSTTFQVAFSPGSDGLKNAALVIASSDASQPLFHIALTGMKQSSTSIAATLNTPNDVPLATSGLNASGLTLDLTLNFTPSPGTNLTIVRNTGLGFINGAFTNAPNGATVNLTYNGKTYPFIAWYYGGDGNDLVLLWPYTGIAAWGQNTYGQLGEDATVNYFTPKAVDQTGVLAGKTIVQLVCGGSHSLALSSEGKVYSWGDNGSGQLGDNTTTRRNKPVEVNTANGTSALFGKNVIAIAAGEAHSLALCSDGTVAAWGLNYLGQIGDNTTTSRNTPVLVNTLGGTSALFGKTVLAIAAGYSHNLALCSDGTIATWGGNGLVPVSVKETLIKEVIV